MIASFPPPTSDWQQCRKNKTHLAIMIQSGATARATLHNPPEPKLVNSTQPEATLIRSEEDCFPQEPAEPQRRLRLASVAGCTGSGSSAGTLRIGSGGSVVLLVASAPPAPAPAQDLADSLDLSHHPLKR